MVLKFKRHRQVGTGQRLQPTNLRQHTRYPQPGMETTGTKAPPDRLIAFRGLCVSAIFFDVTQICGVASQTAARKVGGGVGMNVPAIGCAVCLVA